MFLTDARHLDGGPRCDATSLREYRDNNNAITEREMNTNDAQRRRSCLLCTLISFIR